MTVVTSVFNFDKHSDVWKRNLERSRDSWLQQGFRVVIVGPKNDQYLRPGMESTGDGPFPTIQRIAQVAASQSGLVALMDADLVLGEGIHDALKYLEFGKVKMLTSRRWTYNPGTFNLDAAIYDPNDEAVDFYLADSKLFEEPSRIMLPVYRCAHNIWDTWMVGYFNRTLGGQFRGATKFRFLFHPTHEERHKPYGDPKVRQDQYLATAAHPDELEFVKIGNMKVIVFSICYNQAHILPWWMRHYSAFADEISVFDEQSNDGSRELLTANPKVILRDWPYQSGIEEDLFLQFAYEWYPKAHPAFDWAMWVDTDEFLYHPDMLGLLHEAMRRRIDVIQPWGYNMMCDGLPADNGQQLWELCRKGVHAPLYNKPVIFRPNATVRWTRGKHHLEGPALNVWDDSGIKLLHYRYLGYEYTKKRNAINLERCGLFTGDKAAAWSCQPDYRGEGSAEWAKYAMRLAEDVV